MGGRGEVVLPGLALAAAAFVLTAPVLGRAGLAGPADVAMGLAAACGLASFGLAGLHTWRAARGRRGPGPPRGAAR